MLSWANGSDKKSASWLGGARCLIVCVLTVIVSSGCSSVYYDTMEKFGVHKRDLLVDRIEDGREAQAVGQKQFEDALTVFKQVVKVENSDVEAMYKRMNKAYINSRDASEDIHQSISDIEKVADDLFDEWQTEIEQYSNARLKQDSEQKLRDTKSRYRTMMAVLKKSESKLSPILTVMYDQVLYLKHNLNAHAIGSIKNEVIKIDRDIVELLAVMDDSIREAEAFISSIQ